MDFSGSTGARPRGARAGRSSTVRRPSSSGSTRPPLRTDRRTRSASSCAGALVYRSRAHRPDYPAVNTAINSGSPGGWHELLCGSQRCALARQPVVERPARSWCSPPTGSATRAGTPPAGALGAAGAVVHSIAIGDGSSCTTDGGEGTLDQIAQSPGVCTEVQEPERPPRHHPGPDRFDPRVAHPLRRRYADADLERGDRLPTCPNPGWPTSSTRPPRRTSPPGATRSASPRPVATSWATRRRRRHA